MPNIDSGEDQRQWALAYTLAVECQKAGLVVLRMTPLACRGGRDRLDVTLYRPSGEVLVDGSHETPESIREHVQRFRGSVAKGMGSR